MELLRRLAPAVFVGTAAVLVASNASTGAPVAAPEELGTTDPNAAGAAVMPLSASVPEPRWEDEDDEHDEHDEHDDDDNEYVAAPAPAPVAPRTNSAPTTADCSAAEQTGPIVRTEWGPVQVAAKVQSGRVCAVRVIQYPDGDRKSVSINARAIPALEQRVLVAGDASFDGVSGATVTSDGYRRSLQAILDQAR